MKRDFRVAVVGAGGIGSAAAYWLSRVAGPDVVCLEQFTPGHDLGASEDHSRIIRLGYHAERYTAITRAAYDAWAEAEEESGVPLVHRTGIVNAGRPGTDGGAILDDYVRAMTSQGIPFERFGGDELMARWPQFRAPDGYEAVYQADGGILDIRRGCAVHLALARARGATVVADAAVRTIEPGPDGVVLETAAGSLRAERVVVCAGAWTAGLLRRTLGVELPIRLTAEQVTYFATPHLARFAPDRFPVWIWHGHEDFYGFPVYGAVGTKAARENLGGAPVDVDTWDRVPDAAQSAAVAEFVEGILPGYSGPELATRACLYDMPPDRDFVLDLLPGHPQLAVAIGAGHAAKFAGLFGRVLADLALDGSTEVPIGPFRADRPALTDPGYEPGYRLGGAAVTA